MNYRRIERVVKGFANHRRLQILELLKKQPGLSLEEVADELKIDFRTASVHIQKMAVGGLVTKRSAGPSVLHKLTDRGDSILTFCRKLE